MTKLLAIVCLLVFPVEGGFLEAAAAASDATGEGILLRRGGSATVPLPQGLSPAEVESLEIVVGDRAAKSLNARLEAGKEKGTTLARVTASKNATLGSYRLLAFTKKGELVSFPQPIHVLASEAEVRAEVERRNAREKGATSRFEKQGWKSVDDADATDERVLDLDPKAGADPKLRGALRTHLRTNSFAGLRLERLSEFAEHVSDRELRRLALEALGRSRDPRAAGKVLLLHDRLRSSADRAMILENLRPKSLSSAAGKVLLASASDKSLPQALRKRLTSRAALTALAGTPKGKKNAEEFVKLLPHLDPGLQTLIVPGKPTTKVRREVKVPPFLQLSPEQRKRIGLTPKPGEFRIFKVNEAGLVRDVRASDLSKGSARQIFIVPTGYTESQADQFLSDAINLIAHLGNRADEAFTRIYRDRVVYIVQWLPGGPVGAELATSTAKFAGTAYEHPTVADRLGLTVRSSLVFDAVDAFRQKLSSFAPIGVVVLYNLLEDAVATARMPTLLIPAFRDPPRSVRKYGIAMVTLRHVYGSDGVFDDADRTRDTGRPPMHELGHAALNFADEYFTDGLENVDIHDLDWLVSFLVVDDTWPTPFGVVETFVNHFDVNFSELLGDYGSDNLSTRNPPSLVGDDPPMRFDAQGGMFFGRGTFHHEGETSVMGRGGHVQTPAIEQVVRQVFETPNQASRPNDRLRNAGPLLEWVPSLGAKVRLLLFDADKHHRWHPTKKYEVEVSYKETFFDVCPLRDLSGNVVEFDGEPVMVPCLRIDVPRSFRQEFQPSLRTLDLSRTLAPGAVDIGVGAAGIALGAVGIVQQILVEAGLGTIEAEGTAVNIAAMSADQLLNSTLPAIVWPTPYQDVALEVPNPLTEYKWRFRAHNGTSWSGWTSQTKFFYAF